MGKYRVIANILIVPLVVLIMTIADTVPAWSLVLICTFTALGLRFMAELDNKKYGKRER